MRGFTVDEEHLAFEAIKEVGIGGTFLNSRHTLKHFEKELWQPELCTRLDYQTWMRREDRDLRHRIYEKGQKILREHQCRALDQGTKEEITRIIRESEERILKE
jgi:trimethylamine--corrinoid protein Co-methyltransferase